MSAGRPEQAATVTPGQAAYELGFRTDEELAEIVKAAKHYDHDNRPRGNWGSVPDHQAARLIIGALRAMHQRDRANAEAAVVTAGTEHLAEKIRGLAIGDEDQP